MKAVLSSLFNSKSKRIVRCLELILIAFSIIFFIYEKATVETLHFEADEFAIEESDDGLVYKITDLTLKRGVYTASLSALSSQAGASFYLEAPSLSGIRLKTAATELPTTSLSSYIRADLKGNAKDVSLVVKPASEGLFEINAVDLVKTCDASKKSAVVSVFIILGLEFLLAISFKNLVCKKVAFALTCIFLVSCYPLFSDYLMESHDILFHLARIEGLAQGLKSGAFPVKVQPFWGNDYGYAVGVFYGDILLYFPALLRLTGFSVQAAFQIHFAFIQLCTVLLSYYSFRKIFKKADIALFGTALYTFSIYRLENTYTRAAIGEFTAMMFLPLILCGFYMILIDRDPDEKSRNRIKSCIITALGLTGLIGSHILSCEMIAFFIILLLLICIKKVFIKRTFIDLVSTLVITLLMNIGFLIPFLDFYFQPLNIRSENWQGGSSIGIQEYGLSFLQLFSFFGKTDGGTYTTIMGVNKEVSFSTGIVLILLFLAFIALVIFKRGEIKKLINYRMSLVMAGLAILTLFMSTCYFPWNAIAASSKALKTLTSTIQFPWRFLEFATVFLVIVACFVYQAIKSLYSNEIFVAFVSSAGILLFTSTAWFLNDLAISGEPYRIYDTYEVCNYAFYSAEYLYEGTDYHMMEPGRVLAYDAQVNSYAKKGTNIKANISCGTDPYIEFPLNYYKYYTCASSTGQKFELSPGTNNCIKVSLPASFAGDISLSFREPLYWRLAEVISAVSFAFFITLLGIYSKEN